MHLAGQVLRRPRTPTTTGKIKRWYKTLRTEFLAACDRFASLACAQAELDAWVSYYNRERPHQSLGMATPASRFTAANTASPGQQDQDLPPPTRLNNSGPARPRRR